MGFADAYLSKQKGFSPHISSYPAENLRFLVVIPAFCEPDITTALQSLWNCDRPACHTEVIIVVNAAENADLPTIQSNRSTLESASQWIAGHFDPAFCYYIIDEQKMPIRDAGVGLARRTGMDEAIYRFNLIDQPHGYILSFDADSQCDPNYFTAIETALNKHSGVKGFDVYFEHPVAGSDFSEKVYQGAAEYELHLRYVNQFLRFIGFPFAYHTVGSCFGVRADIYAAQGGMNKRQAGEDFYFLHKIIPLGQFLDIHTTRVIPSPRESFRVPFGTGTAIGRYVASASHEMPTYEPDCFLALKQFLQQVAGLYKINQKDMSSLIDSLPVAVKDFLIENKAADAIQEINSNAGSPESFRNRFYRWFDAFRIVKYLNHASRVYYPQVSVAVASRHLLRCIGYGDTYENSNVFELLEVFRTIERGKEKVIGNV